MRLRKQELAALDLEDLANLPEADFLRRVEAMNLYNYASWMMPQLVAVFGGWRLLGDGKTTVLENCRTDFQRACWRLSRLRRSYLVKNQTQQPDYGQFTPLLLLGFKRHQGYSYEQFRELPGLELLLEPELLSTLVQDQLPQLNRDRILEIREQGLAYKTGPKAGTTRLAESTWQLYGIQDTELGAYPKLLQTMITQCWLAHPKHRRPGMILDPWDWDNLPQPLIDQPLPQTPTKPKLATSGLPWLD